MRTVTLILFLSICACGQAQQEPDIIKKEFAFLRPSSGNTLIVANISGSIHVEGSDSETVIVEAEKRIGKGISRADGEGRPINVGYIDRGDTIILYVDGLCSTFGKLSQGQRGRHSQWGYTYEGCNENGWTRNENHDFVINFSIKIPASTHVILSTVNKGDVVVSRCSGNVIAENINGNVRLDHIAGASFASTINGDLNLNYDKIPGVDSRYYTLNGNIHADFPKGLAAIVSFKSFNGDFYTNVNDLQLMPVTVEQYKDKEGIRYKLDGNRYSVGNGGVNLNFETFNGNVYLKEKTN